MGKRKVYLGVDVGSVSTNLVLRSEDGELLAALYLRTRGQPIKTVQEGMAVLADEFANQVQVIGVGTTGSARTLTGVMLGADVVKNEITAHAVAASAVVPGVRTVLEIGGQDSKIIILRDGVVTDFAMNTVCAAGTGSFLDQQAGRLGLTIEEFGRLAIKARKPVRIAGRCTVFAESDMIHKQQMGHGLPDIVAGLCEALVRNYLSNIGKGKEILDPVVFQGGVAANPGIRAAFTQALETEVLVPPHHNVMGAIGAAILAQEKTAGSRQTNFRGFDLADIDFTTTSFDCRGCANRCEVVQVKKGREVLARWGSRCGKWEDLSLHETAG